MPSGRIKRAVYSLVGWIVAEREAHRHKRAGRWASWYNAAGLQHRGLCLL